MHNTSLPSQHWAPCSRAAQARVQRTQRSVVMAAQAPQQHQGGQGTCRRTVLRAVPLTPEAFKPFGQVVGPTDDGAVFGEDNAQLCLDRGTPRFYIMRLPRRGMQFDRITYHAEVTQCLGGLGQQPWYLAVARPSGSVQQYPKAEDLTAFRMPPGVFIKLERGTWHAGPLFDNADFADFYNLELKDTNVVDHNTHHYADGGFEVLDV